ncbi:SCO family protein [Sporosarcina thermotolerans]|uniref:SCO family protein n=1 Tax=Sporosarcina thermotolerans TaxID=633404 RepID=A0AAW9A504_9BACL|nr:SCO family protein [Sporosarcina thermotolerans]MDW0115493.1 SCO family protein [Sporosarcina thermotolerans]WHT47179.1 SCO family protein [Sporosarcina thermotolerans]
MPKKILLSLFLPLMLLLSACSMGGFKPDHKYKIESFDSTNQHNEQVSLDDLKGTVWIAQFVFTNCDNVCLPMMANMADLQKQLQDEGIEDYKIVSFSVDPEFDSPEVLQDYLEAFDPVDPSKWEMLTGYSQETIENLAIGSFKTFVTKTPNDVIHGSGFSLVNKDGVSVKTYNGAEDVPYDQMVKDIKALIKEEAKS